MAGSKVRETGRWDTAAGGERMKVSMRRLMALAMAGTMTLMAGCSQASSSATGSSDTQIASGESGAEKAASGDKTVIEYWHCNAETQGGLVVDDLVKKFNEENDHIEVVAKYNPDMYKGLMQNLQAEAATGNTPALVQIGWAFLDYFSNNFDYVAPQDAIDKFDSEDANFLTDNFLPNVLDLAGSTGICRGSQREDRKIWFLYAGTGRLLGAAGIG